MLGFERPHEPIKEPFASQLIEQLIRIYKGEYNEEDLVQMKRTKESLSKYHAIWVDKEDNKN